MDELIENLKRVKNVGEEIKELKSKQEMYNVEKIAKRIVEDPEWTK